MTDEFEYPDDHPMRDNEQAALRQIGAEIVAKRGDHSQRWLATHVGTTQTSIRRLERGESNVSAVLLARTSKLLAVNFQEFFMNVIEPEEALVEQRYEEYRDQIEERTSSMQLTELDFHAKRELLRLLKLWPR